MVKRKEGVFGGENAGAMGVRSVHERGTIVLVLEVQVGEVLQQKVPVEGVE